MIKSLPFLPNGARVMYPAFYEYDRVDFGILRGNCSVELDVETETILIYRVLQFETGDVVELFGMVNYNEVSSKTCLISRDMMLGIVEAVRSGDY